MRAPVIARASCRRAYSTSGSSGTADYFNTRRRAIIEASSLQRLLREPFDAAALGADEQPRAGIGPVDVECRADAAVQHRVPGNEFPLATMRAPHLPAAD